MVRSCESGVASYWCSHGILRIYPRGGSQIPDDMEPIIIERNAYGMITTMNYSHSYNSLVRHDMICSSHGTNSE